MATPYRLIVAPTAEPITLDEARAHCRADPADDALLQVMIQSARESAEHILGRVLMPQTWRLSLDAFPPRGIPLDRPPVQGVTSVVYTATDGTDTTLATEAYLLDDGDEARAWLLPAEGYSWPSTMATANAVLVTFVAGYADAASVPAPIKSWLLLQVGALYRNREAFAVGVPVAELPGQFTDRLLDRYRIWAV